MSPFVTGSITISDSISLNSLIPLAGEELIEIDFETPMHQGDQFKYKKSFHLYKMEANENFSMKNAVIQLMFISIDGFTDMNTRISQTFRGSVSDTVKKLLKTKRGLNTQQNIIVEDTQTFSVHTSNFWNPSQNIMYLAAQAYNSKNNPNFMFYENRDGFNFVSLDKLYEQPVKLDLIRDQKNRDQNDDGTTRPNAAADYNRVIDMSTHDFYDYIDRLETGMYGSSIYHYDVQTRKLNFLQRNNKLDFKTKLLNENDSIIQPTIFLPQAKMLTKIIHRGLYPDAQFEAYDIDLRRMSLLKKAESFKTNIRIYGRANYKVGDIINLKVYANKPTTEKTTDKEMFDPMFTGKYLVSALSHDISNAAHYCNIELIRDSYSKV